MPSGVYARQTVPVLDRFNDKWTPEPYSGCWIWTDVCMGRGYGVMNIKGNIQLAHRISWQLHRGEIPDGMFICHHCDTRSCVNPNHMFLGSPADNLKDAAIKGRMTKKLSIEQVTKIRDDPRPHRQIASDYGVSHALVGYIKRNLQWRYR